jgi:hypothetical protein
MDSYVNPVFGNIIYTWPWPLCGGLNLEDNRKLSYFGFNSIRWYTARSQMYSNAICRCSDGWKTVYIADNVVWDCSDTDIGQICVLSSDGNAVLGANVFCRFDKTGSTQQGWFCGPANPGNGGQSLVGAERTFSDDYGDVFMNSWPGILALKAGLPFLGHAKLPPIMPADFRPAWQPIWTAAGAVDRAPRTAWTNMGAWEDSPVS